MEKSPAKVFIYDTTLRDGAQGEGMALSTADKVKIALKLDQLGIDFIEGGWPASNPKDLEFFRMMKKKDLNHARLSAFTSTRRPGYAAAEDINLTTVLDLGVQVAAIVGKAWDFQVTAALETSLEENLEMVEDSIRFLCERGVEVIFDAEHFFDGFKQNQQYAMEVVARAAKAGSSWIALCDTNGGALPEEIAAAVEAITSTIDTPLAIHTHNDGGLAVANTLAAVRAGVRQVQGTINGYGERCGNANLCSVIPNLELKMGYQCVGAERLRLLAEVSHYVSEISNMPHYGNQPFVGRAAFAHKGGIHVSAILKNSETYEHVNPEAVGNRRRVLVSELAGISNLKHKAQEFGLDVAALPDAGRPVIEYIKQLEHQGYQFEGADASLELLLRRAFGVYKDYFALENAKVMVDKRGDEEFNSEATVKVKVDKMVVHTAAEGDGPVNALDKALRKALLHLYPCIAEFHLSDYKVRVLDETDGTGAAVRVMIETADATSTWCTVGVSENIIEASFQALMDSFNFALLKRGARPISGEDASS